MANVNLSDISQITSENAVAKNSTTVNENSTTEVHNNEQAQTEVSAAEQSEYSAVSEISEEYEAAGAEAAVSEISEETGISGEGSISEGTEISGTTESVVSNVPQKVDTAKNAQAFLLLAGVFGAVIAAMVLKRKFQKDKRKKTVDKSQLTAKERDEIRLAEKKRKKEKKKVVKKKRSVPRTTQKTLPYKCVCDNFLMKVDDNKYSKTYVFGDVNYSIAKQEEQESIFLGYCSVLNSFDTSADIQITVHNNRVNKDEFNRMVLLRYKGNEYDHYIDVYNEMLKDKMEKGQNGIIRKKYLTVTLQAPDLETARGKFGSIDLELTNAFKKIGSIITPLSSNDRVNLLKDIFKSVDDKIPELSEKDFKR